MRRRRSSRAASRLGDRGFFVKPTIVTDVDQSAEIVQNEVFGPVVTMQAAASDDAAIEMANDVRYGLAASVFSENVGRAMKVAAKLDFGTVWVNEHLFPLTPGDAARRLQGVGLREGHVDLLDGGVHPDQARRGEAGRVSGACGDVTSRDLRGATPPDASHRLRRRPTSGSRTSSSGSTARSPSTESRSRSRAGRSSRCSGRRAAARRRRCA